MGLLEMLLGPRLPQITPDDLLGRLSSAQPPVLLDVRTTVEYSSGHISGAINIPHEQLPARAAELEAHRERDIIIYCRSGVRAGNAARALQGVIAAARQRLGRPLDEKPRKFAEYENGASGRLPNDPDS